MKMKKILALALAALLLVAVTVAGTVAYLTATTEAVQNTFTAANLGLTLQETEADWTMQLIPGTEKAKDPKVTVTTNVETYVFVQFDCTVAETSDWFKYDFLLNNGSEWTQGDQMNGLPQNVWYTTVTADDSWYLLGDVVTPDVEDEYDNGSVLVESTATATNTNTNFNMTFDAWAIQVEGFDTVFAAWQTVNP